MFSANTWFKQHEFSSYFAYILSDADEKPGDATRRGNCWMSRSPDGFTFGNTLVFAAIGVPLMEAEQINEFYTNPRCDVPFIKDWDLSRLTLLVGPDKATAHMQSVPAIYKVQEFHVSFTVDGNPVDTWLKDAERQEARRVKGTSIAVTASTTREITIATINFAPLQPSGPVVHRIVSIKNNGSAALQDLALDITFENRASSWAWEVDPAKKHVIITEERDHTRFAVKILSNDEDLRVGAFSSDEKPNHVPRSGEAFNLVSGDGCGFIALRLFLDRLEPFAERTFYVTFFPIARPGGGESKQDTFTIANIIDDLSRTESAHSTGPMIAKLKSSDDRLADLYDSILSMGLCHVSERGIHTGSVYYSHSRAWTRDNYWIQKAFHHAGFHDAAIQNCKFFLDAWIHNDRRFANSYGLNSYGISNPGNEVLVELPWYFLLMITEAIKWAPERAELLPREQVIEVVKVVVTESRYLPGYLFPLNSDETWIWACDVSETGVVLDNAVLALAALVSARRWLRGILDAELLQSIESLASHIHASIKENFLIPFKNRFAAARDDDGTLDESALAVPLAMPFVHDVVDEYPDLLDPATNGLITCWQSCQVEIGGSGRIVRSHSATTALTGNAPGHFIEALACVNARDVGDLLLSGILNFANATGVVYELHDIFDPSWGTEHRRLWDSMSVLQGVIQYIIGTRIRPESVTFTPYCPEQTTTVSIDDLTVRGHVYSFRMARKDGRLLCAVKMDGNEIAKYEGLHDVSIDVRTGAMQVIPVRVAASVANMKDRPKGDYWGRIIPSAFDGIFGHNTIALVHDVYSKNHAIEIARQLAFSLGFTVPIHIESEIPFLREKYDHFIWVSQEIPSLVRDVIIFKDMLDEFITREYNIIAFDPHLPKRTVCWIPNKGHVYRDTNRFVQDVRLHVLPKRQKPMNMHPHGFLRLSDVVGAPVNEVINLMVKCNHPVVSGMDSEPNRGTGDMHFFIQGEPTYTFPGSTGTWQGQIEPRSRQRAMPKTDVYLLVTAVTPYAPFDLAAAGIATGANAIQLSFQADAKFPIAIDITIKLPQTWHPQNLRSPQWERIDDPVRCVKLANGEKEMRISLHPGRPVSRHMKTKLPETCRHLTFVFVKYPHIL